MPSITRTNSTFTSVAEHKAKTNRGTNPTKYYLQQRGSGVSTSSSSASDHAYVTFSSPVPYNVYVTSAYLELTASGAWNGTKQASAQLVTSNWQASKITWSSVPTADAGSQVEATFDTAPSNDIVRFDVTSHIQAVSNGAIWYGWKIFTSNTTANTMLGKGKSQPRLVITYTEGPRKPVQTYPGSATETVYISTGSPTLTIESNLFNTGVSMEAMQVQLSTSPTVLENGSFSTVTWDSNPFATTTAQAHLSTLGAPVAANNDGYWWIARIRGSDNMWSPWSTPVKYYRKDLGTVTLTTPAASPNNKVGVSMPDISWTVAGMVQISYQVLIYDVTKPLRPLWDSDRILGAATSIGVPDGVISQVGKAYRVIVRVWDSENRQQATTATAVAPVMASATRDFTFELSSSVTGVSDFVVEITNSNPTAKLSWTRASMPDYYEIVRDGKVVATNLSSVDTNKQGTSYFWVDYSPVPIKTHVWSVRAIETNLTSSVNPEKSGTTDTSLAWLIDPDSGTMVAISGENPATVSMYEKGNTYEPYRSLQPVRITSTVGRRTGSVSGTLCGDCVGDGTTSEDLQNFLLELREEPGKELIFLLANITARVIVYNISTFPLYGARFGHVYGATFDWHEVGELY